jgi:hypothetical protein
LDVASSQKTEEVEAQPMREAAIHAAAAAGANAAVDAPNAAHVARERAAESETVALDRLIGSLFAPKRPLSAVTDPTAGRVWRTSGGVERVYDLAILVREAQHLPVEERAIAAYMAALERPLWRLHSSDLQRSARSAATRAMAVSPRAVLDDPALSKFHSARIAAADLSYPLLVTPDGDVFDGLHRLCKALSLQLRTARVRLLTDAALQRALLSESAAAAR